MKFVSIYITDKFSAETSYEQGSLVFVWDEFLGDENAISLPALVEEKAAFYRAAFYPGPMIFPKRPLMGPHYTST